MRNHTLLGDYSYKAANALLTINVNIVRNSLRSIEAWSTLSISPFNEFLQNYTDSEMLFPKNVYINTNI